MGVKTNLAGITFTTAGKNAAVAAGADLAGLIAEAELKMQEATTILNYVVSDLLTGVSGESSNISTINTQVTAIA